MKNAVDFEAGTLEETLDLVELEERAELTKPSKVETYQAEFVYAMVLFVGAVVCMGA